MSDNKDPVNIKANLDAVEVLEQALERAKKGEIAAVAVTWVTKENSIDGEFSKGDNQIMMWAAMMHCTQEFYEGVVLGEMYGP